jgi:DNA processing protein
MLAMEYAVVEPNAQITNWQDWIILLHTPGVGPVTWYKLIQKFGSPTAVVKANLNELQEFGLKDNACQWLQQPDLQVVEISSQWLNNKNNQIIPLNHPHYPPLLAATHTPPPLLFVTGNSNVLCKPQIAIVGTRNASDSGRGIAWEFARTLAESGYVVTSGLAIGIDAAAHEGALVGGISVAVSATGLDRVYPPINRDLAHRIAGTGALVSELSPGTPVRKENFPQRNRIISGMCLGVLVVEAAAKSGSLITAKMAAEQNREVFAIPGSIHSPLSKGCHALIRNGAKLVETAEDIIEELGSLQKQLMTNVINSELTSNDSSLLIPKISEINIAMNVEMNLDENAKLLLNHLGYDPVAQDVLVQRSGLAAHIVSATLIDLEMDGYIISMPGGRYCRKK